MEAANLFPLIEPQVRNPSNSGTKIKLWSPIFILWVYKRYYY